MAKISQYISPLKVTGTCDLLGWQTVLALCLRKTWPEQTGTNVMIKKIFLRQKMAEKLPRFAQTVFC
jgi:hypothetical protein